MKFRLGFCSNSSSSSFILFKQYLTEDQIKHIRNWKKFALSKEYKKILEEYAKTHQIEPHTEYTYDWSDPEQRKKIEVKPFSAFDYAYYPLDWDVQETFDVFDISTTMDNYNMRQYLESLGVNIEKCGIVACDGHYDVFGLNDFETDIRDYLNDPDYYNNYREKYWLTSKYYKEKFYPEAIKNNEKYEKETGKVWPCETDEPLEKKKWICEDAGRALAEVRSEFNKFAIDNGYINWLDKEGPFTYEERVSSLEVFRKVFDILNKAEENWKEVDDFDGGISSTPVKPNTGEVVLDSMIDNNVELSNEDCNESIIVDPLSVKV